MIGFDLASQIKERLTALEVVEFYGFHPDRSGFVQCPFHQGEQACQSEGLQREQDRMHCFGCGAAAA